MTDPLILNEHPQAKEMYMIVGWRQWADAGSISSKLPEYLVQRTNARRIGSIKPDGFYLFQIPGTHDLVRPTIEFEDGFPKSLEKHRNEFYYADDDQRGIVYFLGDEPHLDIDRYINTILEAAKTLNVKRIISLGGVYAELPYEQDRPVSGSYSLHGMRPEMEALSMDLTNYHGGASIGSYLCRRASEENLEYAGFYAFVPSLDFSQFTQLGNMVRIENDFKAWLNVMRRVNHMLKTTIDLSDLESKTAELDSAIAEKIEELHRRAPDAGIMAYMQTLSEAHEEQVFDPLDTVWEDELRRLLDDESETDEDETA